MNINLMENTPLTETNQPARQPPPATHVHSIALNIYALAERANEMYLPEEIALSLIFVSLRYVTFRLLLVRVHSSICMCTLSYISTNNINKF